MKTVRRIAGVGVAVASDMLGVTLAGLIYTPLVYTVIHALAERRESRAHAAGLENHR
jgi:multidrug efflux pump